MTAEEPVNTPVGTTHLLPALPGSFDETPTYMKWAYEFTGPESGNSYFCWWNWHQGQWHKDRSFCDRHKRLQRI